MKKLLALSLALVMALGMTSVAFAAEAAYVMATTGYKTTDGVVDDETASKAVAPSGNVTPGSAVYYQIFATDGTTGLVDSTQVKGATIKQTWDMGKDYIDSVSIVKKKLASDDIYYYFVCVTFKASTSTTVYDFAGDITVKKTTTSSSVGSEPGVAFSTTLSINGTYSFSKATSMNIASESTKLYDFAKAGAIATQSAKDTAYAASIATAVDPTNPTAGEIAIATAAAAAVTTGTSAIEGDQTITTDAGHYFDVDVTGQGKVLLYYDEKYNSSVAAVYPSANLDFVSFNGPSFNKTGELTILASAGTYLYALNADGSLSTVKSTYDEYEEAFKITTRTLGKYVISDTELKLVAPVSSSTVSSSTVVTSSTTTTPVKPNPGTGAAA